MGAVSIDFRLIIYALMVLRLEKIYLGGDQPGEPPLNTLCSLYKMSTVGLLQIALGNIIIGLRRTCFTL